MHGPPHPEPGQGDGRAHQRRLRLPHRSQAAPRSGVHAGRGRHEGSRDLLRERRPELGAGGDDQGPPGRRRHRGGRGVSRDAAAVRLAQEPRLLRHPGHPFDQAPDQRPARRLDDGSRRARHQARPRRHKGDRVLRPDPAAHLGRARSLAEGPRDLRCAARAGPGGPSRIHREQPADPGLPVSPPDREPPADDRRPADP